MLSTFILLVFKGSSHGLLHSWCTALSDLPSLSLHLLPRAVSVPNHCLFFGLYGHFRVCPSMYAKILLIFSALTRAPAPSSLFVRMTCWSLGKRRSQRRKGVNAAHKSSPSQGRDPGQCDGSREWKRWTGRSQTVCESRK